MTRLNKLKTKPASIRQQREYAFDAIGTKWHITIGEPIAHSLSKVLHDTILRRIETFDKTYSRFREDSLVAAVAKKAGSYEFPADARPLFELYRKLYDATNGNVTPLIGQGLVDTGYDSSYSLQPKKPRPIFLWDDVMSYRHPILTTARPLLLDFGAAGKGYLVDIIGELIKSHGVEEYTIDAGGDCLHQSAKNTPIKIGLEHPRDTSQAIGIATIRSQSLCGSAVTRRTWGKYHHILDPKSLTSPRHLLAAWVVAGTALLADGLTTALFFVSPAQLQRSFRFEHALVYDDLSLEYSPGFPAEFFSAETAE